MFYFHSDHLGSATFLTHGNGHANEGLKVANSTKFFTPFGEYRIEPPSPVDGITDRGYTGHKHNDEIGLIYMNARFYVPSIGRFASADTIVPQPGNPQSFNRFTYVLNNPLKYIDPTGHRETECDTGEGCDAPIPSPAPDPGPEPETEPEEEPEDCIIKPPICEPWGPPMDDIDDVTTFFDENEDGHQGIDMYGDYLTELLAMGNGVVVATGFIEGEEGYFVIIEYKWEDLPPHVQEQLRQMYPDIDFGPGKSIYVQYQHMQKGSIKVSAGDRVTAGQVVGNQGGTGRTSKPSPAGDHLHIEVRVGRSGSFYIDSTITEYGAWHNDWKAMDAINPNDIWKFY